MYEALSLRDILEVYGYISAGPSDGGHRRDRSQARPPTGLRTSAHEEMACALMSLTQVSLHVHRGL